MANKKYYWLKLQKDFFKRHDIRIVESMPNGKDYVLFYLKLLVESIDHDGELRFNEAIPYNEDMLATVTNTNIDIVRSAMKVFVQLGMIDILSDETIFMAEVSKMIGSETEWARKKRDYRNAIEDNVLTLSAKCPTEIEIDKETETEEEIKKEIKKERIDYQQVADMYNEICISFPRCTTLSEARKKSIKARLNKYSLAEIEQCFVMAEESDFLKGSNSNNWSANFDWLLKDSNMAKVLDGNYQNKPKRGKNEPSGGGMTTEEYLNYWEAL